MGLGSALRNLVYVATDTTTDATATYTIITDGGPGMYADWSHGMYSGGMSIPGAWRAALLLADLLGGVPWHGYLAGSGGLAQRMPGLELLEQPNPPDTRMTTLSSLALDLIWHGNAVGLWSGRDADGRPAGLVPMPADQVRVRRVGQADNDPVYPVGEVVYSAGRMQWPAAQVLHVKGPCRPGALRGSGVLENHLRGTLALADDLATQARGVADTAVPSVDIQVDNPDMTPAEAEALKASFVASQSTRKPFVHGPTVTATPLAWNPSETQLLDARKFTLHELALIFGLDPSWLGAATSSRVYSNITEDTANLLRFSLGGHLARFEQSISAAMPPGEHVAANLDGLLRATTKPRYEAHQIALAAGFLTVDEVRALENLPPVVRSEDGGAAARNVAEMVQKVYLGVGRVLTPDDARSILNLAGAGLGPATPELVAQAAAIAAKGTEAQRAGLDQLEHRDESDLFLYWVVGKGRARWATKPEPLRALYDLLVVHMDPEQARATALSWFPDGMGRPVKAEDGQLPDLTKGVDG
jgi:HK97 family phage portal protein